jgi:hypothetical protein
MLTTPVPVAPEATAAQRLEPMKVEVVNPATDPVNVTESHKK